MSEASEAPANESVTFDSFGLHPDVLRALTESGYTKPTPIQAAAIPVVTAGRDVMGAAQTGTGKTAGFSLPIIHNLLPDANTGSDSGSLSLTIAGTNGRSYTCGNARADSARNCSSSCINRASSIDQGTTVVLSHHESAHASSPTIQKRDGARTPSNPGTTS